MSWEQLVEIFGLQADDYRRSRTDPPSACPNDGEPLREGPDGELFCIADGWSWPRDAV